MSLRPKRFEDRGEDGVAALELVLTMGLLFIALLLFFPLATTLMAKERLQRVAEETVRFASSAPNMPELGASARRPTACDVEQQAAASAKQQGINGTVTVTLSYENGTFDNGSATVIASCSGNAFNPTVGQFVRVSVSYGASMGPFGGIYAAAGLTPASTHTVTASATAREE